jgi:NF-X1-type zinc finger protein NFXL1
VHVPEFLNRQTLVNELPGKKTELSGTVKSATKSIRSQPLFGVGVRVTNGVRVGVREGVRVGVRVEVRVGVRDGVSVGVYDGVREGVTVALGVNV